MGAAVIYEGPAGTRVDRPDVTIVGATREGVVTVARKLVAGGADTGVPCTTFDDACTLPSPAHRSVGGLPSLVRR